MLAHRLHYMRLGFTNGAGKRVASELQPQPGGGGTMISMCERCGSTDKVSVWTVAPLDGSVLYVQLCEYCTKYCDIEGQEGTIGRAYENLEGGQL